MLRKGFEITLLAATVLGSAIAQPPAQNADKDAMYLHFTKAQALADGDLFRFFARRCLIDPAYHSTISQTNQAPASMEPVKAS